MTWRATVTGELARSVRAAVDDIADALRADAMTGAARDPSVSHGDAGLAVFFGYRFLATGRDDDHALACELLDRSIARIAAQPSPGELFGGFPGVAWALQHLADRLGIDGDPGDDVDDAVRTRIAGTAWTGRYGLITGLAGLGVFALERGPRGAGLVTAVIEKLDELAEHSASGATWRTPPAALAAMPTVRARAPHGCFELGVANGIAGAIAVLARAVASGAGRGARELLARATAWLLAHRLPAGEASTFSRWWFDGPGAKAARHAWYNGDPGIALALLLAARALADPTLEREAIELARRSARRPIEDPSGRVHDASFCLGTSGLVQAFSRLHHHTGDEVLAEAARTWVGHTLAMRRAGTGIAGYEALVLERLDEPPRRRAARGLLGGAAGIGLALLAAITPVDPAWDRLFLMS